MGILANENAIGGGNYQIANSLRLQAASSQYLTRTPASASNQITWTWSAWVKRGALGTVQQLFGRAVITGSECQILFGADNTLTFYQSASSVNQGVRGTAQVFRDPSAWYHIVCAWDTSNATALDRMKVYVNGTQVTLFSTTVNPTLNLASYVNAIGVHSIGADYIPPTPTVQYYTDGYLSEVNFIDGQALTPSSFGTTDTTSGQWVAAKYTGTYGTNGFYLPFSNGTSTTTLGADSSGNSNNWTLTNFTRSAGVSDCWMIDVPSGNGGVSGTQPNSNYCVGNPISGQTAQTISKSNLQIAIGGVSAQWRTALTTLAVGAGKWYGEFTVTTSAGAASCMIGILPPADYSTGNFYVGSLSTNYGYLNDGNKYNNGSATAYGSTYTTGDVIGIAYDGDNNKVWFSKNGTWQASGDPAAGTNAAFTTTSGANFLFVVGAAGVTAATYQVNFGQRSFAYTPPTGFKALCTANLPAATIKQGNKYMDATTYTGNGGTLSVTNAASFKPDFVWAKRRDSAGNNNLYDSVRGVTNYLTSNGTGAEIAGITGLTAFNSNGFSLGSGVDTNASAGTFVGWQWQAGQGSTSSNTNGSITSTVSVNATSGFSIVTYTGTLANATIGHGLGVAPSMIIIKNRSIVQNWLVYSKSIGATNYLLLQSTSASSASSTPFNNTAPTSSVFSVGADSGTNGSGNNMIAYCFAEIAGYSKFGSYTGNGSADGPFVYLGFRPKFIMVKSSSAVGSWTMVDTSRDTYNVTTDRLFAEASSAESTAVTPFDILSNGFKLRTTGTTENASGVTMVYMAFAESPFQNSNSR